MSTGFLELFYKDSTASEIYPLALQVSLPIFEESLTVSPIEPLVSESWVAIEVGFLPITRCSSVQVELEPALLSSPEETARTQQNSTALDTTSSASGMQTLVTSLVPRSTGLLAPAEPV